jgi:hypothetical protein
MISLLAARWALINPHPFIRKASGLNGRRFQRINNRRKSKLS